MENIIIIGSSGHAKVIIDIVECERKYKIIGLIDKFRNVGEYTLGYKIIGKEDDLPELIQKHSLFGGIVAIGDNFVRSNVVNNFIDLCPKFNFVNAIHPDANIARDVRIDNGTVIMGGVTINSSAFVGAHCVINTNSSLDHDSKMAGFSSLAPNVAIGGNVSVGMFTAIGIGSTIIHNVNIGEHTIIGAGSTVLNNIESYKIAYGTPAKTIRKRKVGEKYL